MKYMTVLGTRPEVIKLYPVIKELKPYVALTGQHKDLARDTANELGIQIDEDLSVMTRNQSLTSLTIKLHQKLADLYERMKPNLVIVQGDTTSAMVAALEAFYHQIPVAHVEAGLRTNDPYAPFPEEINRRIITQLATYNFAPTTEALRAATLEGWGYSYKVGQTGIDTLLHFAKKIKAKKKKKLLITLHRRENFDKIPEIIAKIAEFLLENEDWEAIMPVHPNPNISKVIYGSNIKHLVKLVKPLGYLEMLKEMKESSLIVTDSGGLQEEAAALKIPVYVARSVTERPEGVEEGFARMLEDTIEVFKVPNKENPYGDGKSGRRIASYLK